MEGSRQLQRHSPQHPLNLGWRHLRQLGSSRQMEGSRQLQRHPPQHPRRLWRRRQVYSRPLQRFVICSECFRRQQELGAHWRSWIK